MTLVNPGNPNTSSFAIADIRDGSPFDANLGTLGAAVYYERLDVADPDPAYAFNVAQARLKAMGGGVHTMTLKTIPQPWLSIGDVVTVEYNGTTAIGQVSAWSMDAGGEMTVTLRGWRVASDWDFPTYPEIEAGRLTLNAAPPIGVEPATPAPVEPPPESPVVTP